MARKKLSYQQAIGMLLDGDIIGETDIYENTMGSLRLQAA